MSDAEPETATGLTPSHLFAVLLPLLLLFLAFHILDLNPGILTPSSLRQIIFGSPRQDSSFSPPSSPSTLISLSTPTTLIPRGTASTLAVVPTTTIPPYFSLPRALRSYTAYPSLVASEIATTQRSYTRLNYKHKQIGWALGYPAKLEQWREAERVNARVVRAVGRLAREEFCGSIGDGAEGTEGESLWAMVKRGWWARDEDLKPDVGRVREALKHFVRDWSEEGAKERKRIFTPILDVLKSGEVESTGMKVLVPGSGLGRLAWEVSELGYDTTAIELSYFMTLALRFLLSSKTTQISNQHTVHPYAHWFSHSRSSANTLRGIPFPDVVPRPRGTFHLVEDDFLIHQGEGTYDYVVTLFFIDTSLNVIATLEHIYALLRPGGSWINLGPLLWTGNAQARVELSLEEVLRLAGLVGFEVCGDGEEEGPRRRRTVECEYTADRMAMMKWLYQAEFWVARRPSPSA